jgi:hypothetical protein
MGTWALATFGCGLAVGFKSLIFCRMLGGVGEASFVALAAPFIGAAECGVWGASGWACAAAGVSSAVVSFGMLGVDTAVYTMKGSHLQQ